MSQQFEIWNMYGSCQIDPFQAFFTKAAYHFHVDHAPLHVFYRLRKSKLFAKVVIFFI